MKVGDIVRIDDGSWNMAYSEQKGLHHASGIAMDRNVRWTVVAVEMTLPADVAHRRNAAILVENGGEKRLIFTQARFCAVITSEPADPIRVTVPKGTEELIVSFE